MKKSWKQWMAITCALAMIVSLLPVTILAEEGVATPTDLAPVVEPVQETEPAEEEKAAYTARIAAAQRDGKIYLTVVVEPEYTGTVIWEKKTQGTDGEKWTVIDTTSTTLMILPGSDLIGKEIRFRLEDGTTPVLNYVVPELEPVEEPAEGNDEPAVEINQEEPVEENETEPAVEETVEKPVVEESAEEPAMEEEQDFEDYETPLGLGDVVESEPEVQEEPVEETEEEEPTSELTEEETVVEVIAEIPAEETEKISAEDSEAADDNLEIETIEESASQETDSNESMISEKAEIEAHVVIYTYERNENGDLILDENGNPIVTVAEGYEIPVSYLRDENGELVLDENEDPIPTQTVPVDAIKILTLDDVLDPNRRIDIYSSWGNQEPAFGGTVHFKAILYGYDRVIYTIQWQTSTDNMTWTDIDGANEPDYYSVITTDNFEDYWRVELTIMDVAE